MSGLEDLYDELWDNEFVLDQFEMYLKGISSTENFEFMKDFREFKETDFDSDDDCFEAIHTIVQYYFGTSSSNVSKLLLQSQNKIIDFFRRIEVDDMSTDMLDDIASEVDFHLRMQYIDFCAESDTVVEDGDDDVPVSLDELYTDEVMFEEFELYLNNSSYLYFCKDVWEYKLLFKEKQDKKDIKKRAQVFLWLFTD
eukprot:TRINITY_DN4406_c0_g1_i2.p1 TRINITY_DN4406_c0_g1~~TRINITY_DN4406_c0_g1_i2.p1  ORF type:complete len:209 (-),score=55.98 TRINITY_DN4406_c0_g1_i2:281-871(-)